MNNEKTEMINGIEVDKEKAQRIANRIIIKEKRNLRTKELGKAEMIKKIKSMIEEEVECY